MHLIGVPDPLRPGNHIKFPVPFQIGQVSMVAPQLALDHMYGMETAKGKRTMTEIMRGMVFMNYMPGLLQPFWNIYSNRNFFGNPVVPPHMAHYPRHLKSHERTPQVYKTISREMKENTGVSVAPLHIQEFMSSMFTNMYRTVEANVRDWEWPEEEYG